MLLHNTSHLHSTLHLRIWPSTKNDELSSTKLPWSSPCSSPSLKMLKGNDSKDKECPRSLRKSVAELILEINFLISSLGFHHTTILLQNIAVIRNRKKKIKGSFIKKLIQYFAWTYSRWCIRKGRVCKVRLLIVGKCTCNLLCLHHSVFLKIILSLYWISWEKIICNQILKEGFRVMYLFFLLSAWLQLHKLQKS